MAEENLVEEKRRYSLKDLGLFFLILLVSFCSYFSYHATKRSEFSGNEDLIIDYPRNPNSVANAFIDKKISNNIFVTKFIIKVCNKFGYKLKFGEYHLPERVSLFDAIKIISFGKQVVHKFCIPEGLSTFQVLEKLNNNKFLKGNIEKIPDEGSLLPDTYCFKYPATKQDIINQAQKAMDDFVNTEWEQKSSECFLKSPKEVLILASIVEKETYIQHDVVAGMYLNRVKKKMKLQSCPTAIYALVKGQKFSRKLLYSDLKNQDPYNTYVHEGLPPSPITNPGKKSILGVLHPKKSEWLFMYFDSTISGPAFAKTYQDHRKNIAKIRKINLAKVK